ncbi:MAG: beta-lactamase family protein [Cytophagales bacterium]|nr:beta-lactamase family protein [Cytophagales bacterium]
MRYILTLDLLLNFVHIKNSRLFRKPNNEWTRFFILLPFLLIWGCDYSGHKSESDLFEATIDSLAILQKESWGIPGYVIGMIKDNEVIYSKAFGVHGLDTQDPMTTKSLFHMASVSKPFVATAIMQLVEQDKVDLDAKLIEYLPYFKMVDEHFQSITIRQMLNHSSGIPDVDDYEWHKPQFDDQAAERYARSFSDTHLDFVPGERYSYSNAAFDILANVISRASGLTFEAYMKKNIFDPTGMVNSTFSKPDVPDHLATKPHVLGDSLQIAVSEVYPYNRRHAPSSTLHSNVEDMMKWAKVNLNKGKINGHVIYNEESYQILTKSTYKAGRADSVCLGWFVRTLGDYRVINHSGGDTGYSSFFAFIPEMDAALVMMVNNDFFWSGDASRIMLQQLILGHVEKEWVIPIHYKLKDFVLKEGIEKCRSIYLEEKRNNPDKYIFAGWCLDDLGYELLDRGFKEEALGIFLFNVELEPKDAGWHDSVADAYRAMDNKALAIEWYEKALAINPDQEFSKTKLEEIR